MWRKPRKALSLQQYHIAVIEEGIRQADAGELVSQREVKKMLNRLRRKR